MILTQEVKDSIRKARKDLGLTREQCVEKFNKMTKAEGIDYSITIDTLNSIESRPNYNTKDKTFRYLVRTLNMLDFTYEDEFIKQNIPRAAIWEQLAEELGEMMHHAQKCARALRKENPTPCEVQDEVLEAEKELGDVLNCIRLLDLHHDETEMKVKMIRWWHRVKTEQESAEDELVEYTGNVIIRCKDCKYFDGECCDRYADETLGYSHSTQPNFFCACGERKTDV